MTSTPALVLYQPDIPGNTGTILRMAVCLGLPVHLIEPAGFRADDAALQRAGMDYLERSALTRHESFEAYMDWQRNQGKRLVLLTTEAQMPYTDFQFGSGDCLMFGRESAGVPESVHDLADVRLTVPMTTQGRSLNVAMCAAMVAGEAMRQLSV